MHYSIDSRTVYDPSHTTFVAIRGARCDGHDFVRPLYSRGVRSFVVSKDGFEDLQDAEVESCEDPVLWLQDKAAAVRRQMTAQVVAITGSNGKTLVKEWIAQLGGGNWKIERSPSSYNSQIGVPLSILGMRHDCDIALVETGISLPGEMARQAKVIAPDVGIFTHFSEEHRENFPSAEAHLQEKIKLFRACSMVFCPAGEVAQALGRAGIPHLICSDVVARACKEEGVRLESPFEDDPFKENFITASAYLIWKGMSVSQIMARAGRLRSKSHTTVLEIDLKAAAENYGHFQSLVPKARMAVMVKAQSYGAGAVRMARMLERKGVSYLCVAYADEGVQLRAAGITVHIMVMNPEDEAFEQMLQFNLEPAVNSMEVLYRFESLMEKLAISRFPIHIKLNTGMNRSGLDPDQVGALVSFCQSHPALKIVSVFSHLCVADEPSQDDFTLQQISLFETVSAKICSAFPQQIMRHILNSAGIERFPQYCYDMVRLGIGLHGISAAGAGLSSVESLTSKIISLRPTPASATLGYGRRGVLNRDSLIAVLPIGYADGLNRHLGCGVHKVLVRGCLAPIVGSICMDACMVDVTDVPGVSIGDEVEIFGRNIQVSELAGRLDTIPYEIITGIAPRVKRVYTGL